MQHRISWWSGNSKCLYLEKNYGFFLLIEFSRSVSTWLNGFLTVNLLSIFLDQISMLRWVIMLISWLDFTSLLQVIKQSHIILNFLAMEGKVTNSHLDSIWQSAQLKHCSKQVHDLLPPLIKNLEAGPVLHLYDLVKKLPVREHTEQSIYLAQVQ